MPNYRVVKNPGKKMDELKRRDIVMKTYECPVYLVEAMKRHPEINWSAIIRNTIQSLIARLEPSEASHP